MRTAFITSIGGKKLKWKSMNKSKVKTVRTLSGNDITPAKNSDLSAKMT